MERALRWFLAVLLAALAGGWALPARAAAPPGIEKLDLRLIPAMASEDSVTVWLEFTDKGEDGPAGLAALLARAESSLSPRALRRRLRARVSPLVDAHDVPVAPRYLDDLAARRLRPLAVSRWLNRAAVRLPGARLAEVSGLGFVRRIAPVARARRAPEVPIPDAGARPALRSRAVPERSAAALDYGIHFDPVDQIGLPALHACGYTGRGVLVCVLDEGFDEHDRHEALRHRVPAPGHRRDFVEGDTVVTDTAGFFTRHGTGVLGCLAADRPGTYVGAAPGVDLALARTEDGTRETPVEMIHWGSAAEWADSLGADILSSSVGYYRFDAPFPDYTYSDMDGRTTDVTRAAQIAARKGMLVVNAVGNEGNSPWRHLIAPADAHGDSVLAVGAVDLFGDTASFSSAGPSADGRIKPDLVARGVSNPIVSTSGDPTAYTISSGTSFAAPLVAGLMACLTEAAPDRTHPERIRAVRETATRAGAPDMKRGYGIPDAGAAFHRLIGSAPGGSGALGMVLAGPNPVRSAPVRATFHLALAEAGPVDARLHVVDLQGRSIRTLWEGSLCFGQAWTAEWDGQREDGSRAGPGVYWLALEGAGQLARVRFVALR